MFYALQTLSRLERMLLSGELLARAEYKLLSKLHRMIEMRVCDPVTKVKGDARLNVRVGWATLSELWLWPILPSWKVPCL